jgi:hypothetical protein
MEFISCFVSNMTYTTMSQISETLFILRPLASVLQMSILPKRFIIIYPSIMEDDNNMNNNCSHYSRTR